MCKRGSNVKPTVKNRMKNAIQCNISVEFDLYCSGNSKNNNKAAVLLDIPQEIKEPNGIKCEIRN